MKKLVLFTAVAVFTLLGMGPVKAAFISTNSIPLDFSMVGVYNPTNTPDYATNVTSSATVITQIFRTNAVKIVTKDMLNILGAEFGTTFSSTDRIVYNFHTGGFQITDANGNFIKDVSTNNADSSYKFQMSDTNVVGVSSEGVARGKIVTIEKPAGTNLTANATVWQPDYTVVYADGSGNNFHFIGNIVEIITANQAGPYLTEFKKVTLRLNGAGGGQFVNGKDGDNIDNLIFIKASVSGTGKNITTD